MSKKRISKLLVPESEKHRIIQTLMDRAAFHEIDRIVIANATTLLVAITWEGSEESFKLLRDCYIKVTSSTPNLYVFYSLEELDGYECITLAKFKKHLDEKRISPFEILYM